jgi:tetratricopeptide (TPR) repeat protein
MTDDTQLLTIAQFLITGLAEAGLKLTPSHHGHLPCPDAESLPEDARPLPFKDEAQALAWCAVHAEDTANLIRACAARGMHQQVVELVYLKWPVYLRLGVPRSEELELALAAARELGDEPAIAMIQTGRSVLATEGRADEALAALREAQEIYLRLGNLRGQAQALNSIGKIYRMTERTEEAGEAHQTAKGWRRQLGYTRGVGLSTHDLGRVAFDRGEFRQGLALFEEAGHILVEELTEEGQAPDLYDGGLAQIWAARCKGELGQTAAALEQLEQAEQAMIERGSVRGQGIAVETAGHVHEAGGDRENAIASYRRALSLFDSLDAQAGAHVRERLAELTRD